MYIVCITERYFAYSEYTHTLRLQASLTRFGWVCEADSMSKLIEPLLTGLCINMMQTIASYLCRGIEVVITGLTRNQFVPKAHEGSNPSLCARRFNFTLSGWIEPLFFASRSACKSHTDCPRTVKLTIGIKVAVNIRGSTHIRVTEPILDHLHRYLVCE